MEQDLKQKANYLSEKFKTVFGRNPELKVAAPGRVNLIGEHTDYNDGFVLPAGVNTHIIMVSRRREDSTIHLYSDTFKCEKTFSLNSISFDKKDLWSNYEMGVAAMLIEKGFTLGGADILIGGDVPLNAGMSSSAAVEVASALTFKELFNLELTDIDIIELSQKAENKFVGVNCGIMDQFASCLAKKNHALLIDCRSLDYEYIPLDTRDIKIVLVNTNVQRRLVESEYNKRRSESKRGADILSNYVPDVKSLRDVNLDRFNSYKHHLPEVVRKRTEHVIKENKRVLESVAALKNNDVKILASHMWESHESLRDLYEVSCPELDILVEIARKTDGVLGSRMMGGGFGGCTISLVEKEHIEQFKKNVFSEYPEKTGIQPDFHICSAEDGAQVIKE